MAKQVEGLSYAVRGAVLARYGGQLCWVMATLACAPLAVSLVAREFDYSLRYAVLAAVLALSGWLLGRARATVPLQVNEAQVLVALAFVVTPLLATFPLGTQGIPFVDALFEAISGVTTTGLSTLATVEGKAETFRFARAWMQWYGGLGIVVFSLALVVRPGLAAKGLTVLEAEGEDLLGGARTHARRALKVYITLTVVGIVAVIALGTGPVDAVAYVLAAISTGGFAPHDASLLAAGSLGSQWAISLLCLAGAMPLALYDRARQRGPRAFLSDLQPRALALGCAALAGLLLLAFVFLGGREWSDGIRHAPLLAISALSTAGFSSVNVRDIDDASKLLVIVAMLVGGGIGSTGGGFKILRLLIVARFVQVLVRRTALPPHATLDPWLGGRRLVDREILEAAIIVLLFLGVVALSWLPFVAAGYRPLDALFEVVSATGTVGLSTGITSPALPAALKGVLCVDMLMGRLEVVAWLVLLSRHTWIGQRRETT